MVKNNIKTHEKTHAESSKKQSREVVILSRKLKQGDKEAFSYKTFVDVLADWKTSKQTIYAINKNK